MQASIVKNCPRLWLFLEDVAIRNAGDASVMQSAATTWWQMLGKHKYFRERFVQAMAIAPDERRKSKMVVGKYLVAEHWMRDSGTGPAG